MREQLTMDNGQLTTGEGSLLKAQMAAQVDVGRSRSQAGISWMEVVQEQAARLVVSEKEARLYERRIAELTTANSILEYNLAEARAAANRVVALEEQITRLSKSTKKYKGWWKRAVRCVLAPGKDWRQVAIAEQAALRICVAERDEAKKALVEATARLNRYFADWKAAVGQVSDAQARVAELEAGKAGWCETDRSNMLLEMSGLRDELSTVKAQLADAKKRWVPVDEFWHVCEIALEHYPEYGPPDEKPSTWPSAWPIWDALTGVGDYLFGAMGNAYLYATATGDIQHWATGDLQLGTREAKKNLTTEGTEVHGKEGAQGRENAKGDVDALRARHASDLDALRKNHRNEMAGVQALLAEAERRARHGELMVAALRFDLPEAEVARISRECWALMSASPQLTVDSGQLTAEEKEIHHEGHEAHEEGKEGATTESTEGTEKEEAAWRCASCGDELSLSERGYITPKGSRYCEPCYDVHMEARAAKGGAA